MKIQLVDYAQPNASAQFTQSLKDTGFAVIENHPISRQLIEQVYEDWYQFFLSDEKHNYLFDKKTHDGFVPMSLSETAKGYELKDIKEFYHFYPSLRCPEHLRELTMQLYKDMFAMAVTLLGWVERNTPPEVAKNFSVPLHEMIQESERTLLRILHYPPFTGVEPVGAVRAAAHEDINLLTVLPAATAAGLQALPKNGEWQDVPCDPAWIIINVGDMLAECSNGYYQATKHQVINPSLDAAKISRITTPLFLHPRDEVQLSDRHTAGSYCQERYAELGLL